MSFAQAIPQCFVDIYPYEGGQYTLPSAAIISCTVEKDIGADMGNFNILLRPGGPLGINNPPYWSQIITPMSLVVIAMSRDVNAEIVMIGVVRSIGEPQDWRTGSSTQRVISIFGSDFSYFFAMFTYYSLWYLGATGAGIATFSGQSPSDALPNSIGAGLLQGDPGTIGQQWFVSIMAGTAGVLSKTSFPYSGGSVLFNEAMSYVFENYDVTIPFGDYFLGSEGAWLAKFKLIFPFPWYEFFVTTTYNVDVYTGSNSEGETATGFGFSSAGLGGNAQASPIIVARKNPLPQLASESGSFTGIDTSLWNSLQLFQLDNPNIPNPGFLQDAPTFDESQVHNFYVLNPTWMRAQFGDANNTNFPYMFQVAGAGDPASIARYGFRPGDGSINWMSDITGEIASNNPNLDFQSLVGTLLARYCSFYHPTPLMARSQVTTWLRPDILPGCRFRYVPFKNDVTWDFYITKVTHSFVFGGPSTTSLVLSRGLPTSVYADNGNGGMLFNIHTGNAMRKDGVYTTGLPSGASGSLQPIGVGQFQAFLSKIASVYSAPQGS